MTERVRGQIAEKLLIVYRAGLEDMDKKPYLPSVSVCEVASQILDIDGLEVRAENQKLPDILPNAPRANDDFVVGYDEAQQDMLNAGFVKVLK